MCEELKEKRKDFPTRNLFSDGFGSEGLMWTTLVKIGPVLSENTGAVICQTSCNVILNTDVGLWKLR